MIQKTDHVLSGKAIHLGRAMAEMRMLLRQFIQMKFRGSTLDISFEMLEIMSCLWDRDGINQQEPADMTIRDKSSMTYLIHNLKAHPLKTKKITK